MPIVLRAVLGFLAAALSVLVFQQGMIEILHLAGVVAYSPYSLAPAGPLRLPALAHLCLGGGLYGALFGIALPSLPRLPGWLLGFGLGALAVAVGWFVVAPLTGQPIAGGWAAGAMLRAALIKASWGVGVGLIAPLLIPRHYARVTTAY